MAYKQNSITLKPYSANGNEQNTMDDSKAIYTGVYGKDDKLVYTPILDGLRSDIIVNDSTVNEFSFISDFGSYVPELQNGEIVLQSNEESQLVLKTLQATDAEGSISDQVALSLKSQEDGTYLTTLAVDDAFLESSDTVYPVTVSATLTMSTTSSSGITTASVYEDSPTSNYGSETYNGVGVNSTRGNAYTYVKFNLSALSNIRYDNILSAHYDTYELTGSFAYTAVESYIVASTWSESTITWQNKPHYYSDEKVSTVNIGISVGTDTSEPYSMYITSAVQAWRQGLPNNGLVLKSRTDTGVWKQLPSDENTSKPPCLVVTYTTDTELTQALGVNSSTMYYLVNKNSGKYVTAKSLIAGDDVTQQSGNGTALQAWKLTHVSNGYYSIKCSTSTACLEVEDASLLQGANIVVGSYAGADNQLFKIRRNWDGSYRILSKITGDVRGLAVASSSTSNGALIKQYAYTLDFEQEEKEDDWTLLPTQKGEASLFGHTLEATGDIETVSTWNTCTTFLSNRGYDPVLYTDSTATIGLQKLQSSALWLFSGHGETSFIMFSRANEDPTYLAATGSYENTITLDQLSANSLKNLVLCLYSSCKTGADRNNSNMTGVTYKKGAHYVISHPKSVKTAHSDSWITNFIVSLSVGYNFKEAQE